MPVYLLFNRVGVRLHHVLSSLPLPLPTCPLASLPPQFIRLPDLMGMALGMTKCDGILGNELMRDRVTGYFPRRKELVLQQ